MIFHKNISIDNALALTILPSCSCINVGLNSLASGRFNTLRPRKMAAIFQTTFSNAFPWIKTYGIRLKCHWSLFLRVQLTISHNWFRWWLGADQATSHCLNQWWLDYWRTSSLPGLNESNEILDISVIFRVIVVTEVWDISCEIASRRIPLDLADDKPTLDQVMAWCCQASSHYMSQFWTCVAIWRR